MGFTSKSLSLCSPRFPVEGRTHPILFFFLARWTKALLCSERVSSPTSGVMSSPTLRRRCRIFDKVGSLQAVFSAADRPFLSGSCRSRAGRSLFEPRGAVEGGSTVLPRATAFYTAPLGSMRP